MPKKKPPVLSAGAKVDPLQPGLKLRNSEGSTVKQSGRESDSYKDGNIVCARGSLALAASAVHPLVSPKGCCEAGRIASQVNDSAADQPRCEQMASRAGRDSKEKESRERPLASARSSVKSPLNQNTPTASTHGLGDSSGGESAGSETRKVIATRRSSRQSVAAMIERFQQMTRRSSVGGDPSSAKTSSASNRLFRRLPSPHPSLR